MANKKTAKYYTNERKQIYDHLMKKISVKDDDTVKKLELTFEEFVFKYFKEHTQDEFGKQIPLAKFHKRITKKIEKYTTLELIVQVARNHAKTTVFGLFLPIYLMLKCETNFVIIISSSTNLAVKNLINIQKEFEENELLINDFGPFMKRGQWSQGNFIVNRYDTMFMAIGKGQSTRGLKFGHRRPDLVILDDVDDDISVLNQKTITKQTNWVLQNVFPAMAMKKYRFIMLGNKFAPDMVLTRVMNQLPNAKTLKINAIDKQGRVSWNERFKKTELDNIKNNIGSIKFQREYMNNPIVEGSVFKPEWLQWFINNATIYERIITYIDPSFKKEGDFKAIVTVGYTSNKYYILDMFIAKVNMDTVFKYLYDNPIKGQAIWIEANFAQDLHKDTYTKIAKERGENLPIVWDKSKKPNKVARIENMTVYFEQGLVFFNEKFKKTIHFSQFYNEYLSFPTGNNDDGIDALESAIATINKQVRQANKIIVGNRNRNIY